MAPSQTSPARLRALYRSLLRELPPRPILSPEQSPLHRTLRASFTTPSSSPSAPPGQAPKSPAFPVPRNVDVGLAKQLLGYMRAQRTYVGLIERYNPGMGMEQDERVRLTARRVGMNLPVEFDPRRHGNT